MPVVARSAASPSQITGNDAIFYQRLKENRRKLLDEATSTSVTKPTTKAIRECQSKRKQKERAADSTINIVVSQQQSPILKIESVFQATAHPDDEESDLHKIRQKALSPIPRDQKFVVPHVYLGTYSKERFLIYDKRKSHYMLPEALVTGWFDFCQSRYRNIQELGLMKLYDGDIEVRHLLRIFMGLALLPPDLIRDTFKLSKKKVETSRQ
ncbi:hypothetical protein I4U23_011837 [Adineta vaga]|nr:hypothetical protein I4U23_011837 [Adineta vaga]